jgi:hypothetical protein
MSCGGYLLSGAVITMAALGFNRPIEKRESASGAS